MHADYVPNRDGSVYHAVLDSALRSRGWRSLIGGRTSLPLQRAAFCSTSNRLSVHFINHVVIDSILRSEHNFLAGNGFILS